MFSRDLKTKLKQTNLCLEQRRNREQLIKFLTLYLLFTNRCQDAANLFPANTTSDCVSATSWGYHHPPYCIHHHLLSTHHERSGLHSHLHELACPETNFELKKSRLVLTTEDRWLIHLLLITIITNIIFKCSKVKVNVWINVRIRKSLPACTQSISRSAVFIPQHYHWCAAAHSPSTEGS